MKKINEIKENTDARKIVFRILVTGSGILIAVYFYLVSSIFFNINTRESLERVVSDLTNEVDRLDIAYLNSTNEIDREYALSMGFIETNQNIFASRDINYVAIR